MPIQFKKNILIILSLLTWALASFIIADHRFDDQLNLVIHQKIERNQHRAAELDERIRARLTSPFGLPHFLSETIRINRTLRSTENQTKTTSSTLENRGNLLRNKQLADLNQFLQAAAQDFKLAQVFVLNARGDCIASSLWEDDSSCIGYNYSERDFFIANQRKSNGFQYAFGKTTHKGGLYFSAPVIFDNHFLGSVVAKYDVENLSPVFDASMNFLVDNNKVIIQSDILELKFKIIPGDLETNLTKQEIFNYYQRDYLQPLTISRDKDDIDHPIFWIKTLSENYPFLITKKKVHPFGLEVYVLSPLEEISRLKQEKLQLAISLTLMGIILMLASQAIRSIKSKL